MTPTKIAAAAFLAILLILLGGEIYSLGRKNSQSETRYKELQAELSRTEADYGKMKAEFDYLLNPANLEKEFRARFNYKVPGEKMLIIVPGGER